MDIQDYKKELDVLKSKKSDYEKQLAIIEDQYDKAKENIKKYFNTTDVDKLNDISKNLEEDIEKMKKDINAAI